MVKEGHPMPFQMEALPPHILLPTDAELRRMSRTMPPPANCIICNAKRAFRWYSYVDEVRTDEVVDWECNCELQFVLGNYFASRGIGLRSARLGWADLTALPSGTMEWANDYILHASGYANRGLGMTLMGDSGTGKSAISGLILRALMRQGFDGFQIDLNGFVAAHRAGWKDDEAREMFDTRLRRADILVIDEIGKEHDWERGVNRLLDTLLRSRYDDLKPTFFTTNFSEDDLRVRYGSVLVDIMQSASLVHKMHGESWRPLVGSRDATEERAGLSRPVVWG